MASIFLELGLNLKLLRTANGLDQTEMATIAGLSQSQYSKVERGIASMQLQNLQMLCDYFGLCPGCLFCWCGEHKKPTTVCLDITDK